jgi:hypothetical protein
MLTGAITKSERQILVALRAGPAIRPFIELVLGRRVHYELWNLIERDLVRRDGEAFALTPSGEREVAK